MQLVEWRDGIKSEFSKLINQGSQTFLKPYIAALTRKLSWNKMVMVMSWNGQSQNRHLANATVKDLPFVSSSPRTRASIAFSMIGTDGFISKWHTALQQYLFPEGSLWTCMELIFFSWEKMLLYDPMFFRRSS